MNSNGSLESLRAENAELRARAEEAEETLRAIRAGEVDALVVESEAGPQLYILESSEAESNRFRSDILSKVSDAVIAIDADQRLTYMNAAAELQYEVSASVLLGRPLVDLYQLEWLAPTDEADFRRALQDTGHWRGRTIHVKRGGERIRVESTVSRLYAHDGSLAGLLAVIRDITAQSAVDEAIKENELRFREIIDALPAAIYTTDKDGFVTHFNPAAVDFAGRTPQLGVDRWCVCWKLYRSDGSPLLPADSPMAMALREGRIVRGVEAIAERPDGTRLWFTPFPTPLRSAAGDVVGGINMLLDITEQKSAEQVLRQNEALFSTLIDQAPGGVYVVDDQYRMVQANSLAGPTFAAAEPIIGRSLKEIMIILWGDEVAREINGIFRHTLETGERYITPRFTHQRQDLGEERSYDWETQRITLPNGRHGVACYFTDVTEQWRLEEALRKSEQRANNIVQSITDGFIAMDRDWRITYLSARGAEILAPLQKTSENVVGKILWDEFPSTVGTPIENNYRRAMEEGVPIQFEAFYPPLDRYFDLRVYPSASGASLFFLDITERKLAEEALQDSRRILAEQAAALRTADRSKDEFLAMLAHELRNPLAPLRNATEILQSTAASPSEREQAQHLIARQIENMSRMIDDLLDVSRITEGKIELRKAKVSLTTILEAAAESVRSNCAAHRQSLSVTLPENPLHLEADATRLEQVLGNLLGNACKYSGDGSHITLSAERVPDRDEVIIRVADDGIGIDPEILPRVFDLFVQSSRTLDRSHGGLGIGLTIVHRLVVLHGGTIEAHSGGTGQGTEFLVRLPLLPASETTALPEATSVAAARNRNPSLRLLIVDDNKDAAETMAMLQRFRGHETRVAHSGPDALAIAADLLPQAVLLDIGLPEMDGYEVARRLRAIPGLESTFMIALTGYGTEEDRKRASDAGFDRHLVKPADLNQLRTWLEELAG